MSMREGTKIVACLATLLWIPGCTRSSFATFDVPDDTKAIVYAILGDDDVELFAVDREQPIVAVRLPDEATIVAFLYERSLATLEIPAGRLSVVSERGRPLPNPAEMRVRARDNQDWVLTADRPKALDRV